MRAKISANISDHKFQATAFGFALLWVMATTTIYMWHFRSNAPVNTPLKATSNDDRVSPEDNIKPIWSVDKFDYSHWSTLEQTTGPSIGVLMIACNRTELLRSSLSQLLAIRNDTRKRFATRYGNSTAVNSTDPLDTLLQLPIVVSLDCDHWDTRQLVQSMHGLAHVLHYPKANVPVPNLNRKERKMEGYFRISRHYRWAIEETFQQNAAIHQLIIVEEDLNFSPDFFEYFLALSPLLRHDRSVMCISAWNDNGKKGLIDPTATNLLYRTDFFPGLGWMLQRSVWEEELKHGWPLAFWDDWLRHWERMRNRTCVRPEVPRTSTAGKKGVSKGQFFEQHLKHIHHSQGYFPFYQRRHRLLSELNYKQYEDSFRRQVYNKSEEIHPIKLKHIAEASAKATKGLVHRKTYKLTYYTRAEFEWIAGMFGLMSDFKNGVPRTAFIGVVSFTYRGHRAYLAPPPTRKIYIKQWT